MCFGFFGTLAVYFLKSKCTSVKLCGCIEIIRDVDLEAEIEEHTVPPIEPIPTQINSRQPTPAGSRRQSRSNVVDFTTSMGTGV